MGIDLDRMPQEVCHVPSEMIPLLLKMHTPTSDIPLDKPSPELVPVYVRVVVDKNLKRESCFIFSESRD